MDSPLMQCMSVILTRFYKSKKVNSPNHCRGQDNRLGYSSEALQYSACAVPCSDYL